MNLLELTETLTDLCKITDKSQYASVRRTLILSTADIYFLTLSMVILNISKWHLKKNLIFSMAIFVVRKL